MTPGVGEMLVFAVVMLLPGLAAVHLGTAPQLRLRAWVGGACVLGVWGAAQLGALLNLRYAQGRAIDNALLWIGAAGAVGAHWVSTSRAARVAWSPGRARLATAYVVSAVVLGAAYSAFMVLGALGSIVLAVALTARLPRGLVRLEP